MCIQSNMTPLILYRPQDGEDVRYAGDLVPLALPVARKRMCSYVFTCFHGCSLEQARCWQFCVRNDRHRATERCKKDARQVRSSVKVKNNVTLHPFYTRTLWDFQFLTFLTHIYMTTAHLKVLLSCLHRNKS